MKAVQLRQSILQAAVQGKLVPQNIHDEPASELLERIRQEKARLAKEGKIKKEKPLPPIIENEIPYDLPDGWVWCRIGTIALLVTSGSRDWAKFYSTTGAKFLRMGNLSKDSYHLRLHSIQHVCPPQNAEGNRTKLETNDILVSITGEVGSLGRIPDGFGEAYINQHTALIRFPSDLQNEYFPYAFLSPLCKNQFDEPQRGIKNSFRLTDLSYMLIPLPPLAEQQRIVAKVDELMALCDELEAAEKELDTLESRFAEYLPKSILQAAVQGKLVPQNVHDEPATELLKRIQQEKVRLVKKGKIKKEKPLPPIVEDEIPYDLPDGWGWCRLGDIVNLTRGITFPASAKSKEILDGFVRCATTGSVQKEYNPLADVFIPATYVKNENQWLQKNDIMMSSANSKELVGKSCIWNAKERTAFGGFLTIIRSYSLVSLSYLYYGLQYLQKSGVFASYSTQTTNIANLNNDMINNTLFPLPPFAEQQRIVAKVDELMALCDELNAARDISVKRTASNIMPFPQLGEDEREIGIAARGEIPGLSNEAARDIKEMFGDDCNG
jgi:type I restriction enzyme S subunit